MIDKSEALCICGHEEGYHSGISTRVRHPTHRVLWSCYGNWPRRQCRCPRFRLAITEAIIRSARRESPPHVAPEPERSGRANASETEPE